MKCNKVKDKLIAYLNQELGKKLHNKIEDHLQHCGDCQSELNQIKSLYGLLNQSRLTIQLPIAEQDFLIAVKRKISRENIQKRAGKLIPRLVQILVPTLSVVLIVIGLFYLNTKKHSQQSADLSQLVLVSTEELNPEFIYKSLDTTIQNQVLDSILNDISLEDLHAFESAVISNVESDNLLDILSDDEKNIFYTNLLELYQNNILTNKKGG